VVVAEDQSTVSSDDQAGPEPKSQTTTVIGKNVANEYGHTTAKHKASNADIVVSNDGNGDYSNLQDATANASDGDTIHIKNTGTPYRGTVKIKNENITLQSNGATVEEGSRLTGFSFVILQKSSGPNLIISGLNISGGFGGGILQQGDGDMVIKDTTFQGSRIFEVDQADQGSVTAKNIKLAPQDDPHMQGGNIVVKNSYDVPGGVKLGTSKSVNIVRSPNQPGDFDRLYHETQQQEQNINTRIGSAGTGEKFSNLYRSLDSGIINAADLFSSSEQQKLLGNESQIGSGPYVRSLMTQTGVQQTNASHSFVIEFEQGGTLGGATLNSNRTLDADLGYPGTSVQNWTAGETYNTENLGSSVYVFYEKETATVDGDNITYEVKDYSSVYEGSFTVKNITDTDTGESLNSSETDNKGANGKSAYTTPETYGEEMAELQNRTETLKEKVDCLQSDSQYDEDTGECVTTNGGGGGLFDGGMLPSFLNVSLIGAGLVGLFVLWLIRPLLKVAN
jgi:hypothetical protein